MRTKTLLLTAAVSAAGVASSMAQGSVFSVNAVGYVNTTIGAGYSLISNPLIGATNTIQALFASAPAGTQVYKFNGSTFDSTAKDDIDLKFLGPTADKTVLPGEGVFVHNPSTTPFTITFVGEVPQGPASAPLTTSIPKGLSVLSSQVPQAGYAQASGAASTDDLGLRGEPGDQFYQFNTTTQTYVSAVFDDIDLVWKPALDDATKFHKLGVGEAFFYRSANAKTWTRVFSVNS